MNKKRRKYLQKLARHHKQNRQLVVPHPDSLDLPLALPIVTSNRPKNSAQMVVAGSVSFSGPLPHPELLQKYNDVIPNGAERIMQMAEQQQQHRHELEATVVKGNVSSETRGQYIGAIIAVVVLGSGTYLAAIGHAITGSIFVGVDLVALVSVFVLGKRAQRQELEKKNEPFKKK